MNKHLFIFTLLLLFTLLTIPPRADAQTSQATFSFSPNTGSFSLNDTIPVDLNINATNATGITSVKASLNFDKDLLEVVSLDSSQSSFSFQWEQSFDNTVGTISIERSNSTPRLGNHLITTITFKTKTLGTSTIDYDPNCFAVTIPTCLALKPDDTNILAFSTGATFTVASGSIKPSPSPSARASGDKSASTTTSSGELSVALYNIIILLVILAIAGVVVFLFSKSQHKY